MLAKWQFTIQYNYRAVKIDAEIISRTGCMEVIKLTTEGHVLIIESNRPLLVAKGLKHKPIFWRIKEGHINNSSAFELMQRTMEAYLKR